MLLVGKRVVVLGGTSGIGLAVAEAAAAEKARCVVVSSTQGRVDDALARLPTGTEGHVANIASEASVQELFAKIGPFDHLVLTAGDTVWQRPVKETDLADAQQFFTVRFWGAFSAVKHARDLLRPGGSIVLTSSTLPKRPSANFVVGASIAGAVEAMGRALAVELAPIRVNVVAPGVVRTPLWNRLPEAEREALFSARAAKLPVGRVGEPQDIAEVYLFLMRSEFVTGQVVIADGGMLLV